MENTFLFLSTCSTCMRIIKELGIADAPYLQDVKQHLITAEQLAHLYQNTKSYESLINKRGRVFAQLKREGTQFTEAVYKQLLETEYSCLKRPILVWNNKIYLGNSKKIIAEMHRVLHG